MVLLSAGSPGQPLREVCGEESCTSTSEASRCPGAAVVVGSRFAAARGAFAETRRLSMRHSGTTVAIVLALGTLGIPGSAVAQRGATPLPELQLAQPLTEQTTTGEVL